MKTNLFLMVISFVLFIGSWRVNAQEPEYYSSYSDYCGLPDYGDFTAVQGMCIDRNNGVLYTAKINQRNLNDVRTRLTAVSLKKSGTGKTPVLQELKNSDTGLFDLDLGHANDITVIAEKGGRFASIYAAVMKTGKYKKRIVKVRVDTVNDTFRITGTYRIVYRGKEISASGIAYDERMKKFIIRSGNNYFVGDFDDGDAVFTCRAKFTLNYSDLQIKGEKLDLQRELKEKTYRHQGMAYYRGCLYTVVSKFDGNGKAVNVSIILPVKMDCASLIREQAGDRQMNKTAVSKVLSISRDLSFRIISKKYRVFEMESLDIYKGALYFNANRDRKRDFIGTIKNFTVPE